MKVQHAVNSSGVRGGICNFDKEYVYEEKTQHPQIVLRDLGNLILLEFLKKTIMDNFVIA